MKQLNCSSILKQKDYKVRQVKLLKIIKLRAHCVSQRNASIMGKATVNLVQRKKFCLFRTVYFRKIIPAESFLHEIRKILLPLKPNECLLSCKYFFFCLGFLSPTFTIHSKPREGGGYFFNSSLLLPSASQFFRHQVGDYC